jgi:recombination protein RecA
MSQPDSGEEALSIAERLVESQAFGVIGVDSVAALVPQAELNGEMGDAHVGLQARLMSQAMRKLTAKVSNAGVCLVFINQIREKIGVMFGSPETTAGGRALKFYASVRLDVRRVTTKKEGEKIIGNMVKVKAVKNKVSAPFRETEVPLLFDSGLDADGSVFDAAVAAKVIDKSGTWYSYMGERLGQGRDNSVVMLVSLGKVDEVLKKVREQADESGIEPTVLPTTEPTGGEVGLPETLIPVDTALGQ